MKNPLIALALTITVTTGVSAALAATTTYNDINNNWAKSDITNMVNQNVMTGFNDGQFHPDAWVTRIEFGNMTARALGLQPQQADIIPSIRNVSQNQLGLTTVDDQTLISQYPSNVFRPNNPVRRAEVLSALAGTLNKPLLSEQESEQVLNKYSDASQVPANIRRNVATAIHYNLLERDPSIAQNTLQPLNPVSRAELAAILNNLSENRSISIVQNGQIISAGNTQQDVSAQASAQTLQSSTPSQSVAANQTDSSTATQSATTAGTLSSAPANITATESGNDASSVSAATAPQPSVGASTTSGTSMVRESSEDTSSTTTASTESSDDTSTISAHTPEVNTTTSSHQSSTTSTDQHQSANGQSQPESQTTTTTANATTGERVKNWLKTDGTPYRNSADTIPEFRSVNTTPTASVADPNAATATLPANTTFTTTLAKSLYSAFNRPGDPVMVIVDHPVMDASGRILAPAGSKVLGTVSNVVSYEVSGDPAQLGINFTGLITPDGQRIPISATINNTDGILKAGELQGVVFHPNRSLAALKSEINTASGALYGTKAGKAAVLDAPMVSQMSDRPMDPMDISRNDIVLGIGDKLQLRIDSEATNNQ